MKKELMLKVNDLMKLYEDTKEEINKIKANGNLSKLINLTEEFDETFDTFFDNEELRRKYNSWSDDEINLDVTNNDLLKMLDEKDLNRYIDFLENYIEELKDELNDLKNN